MKVESGEDGVHTFSDFPPSAVDDDDDDDDDDTDDKTELLRGKEHPAWSFAYYQELFDVDTRDVLNRVKGSVIPLPSHSFNSVYIKSNPDMYGPFWICATLVICVGVCGNLTTLFNNISNSNYHYQSQFQLLPIAAIIIYCYIYIFPLFIKIYFLWRKSAAGMKVSHIICVYGYALFVFIPASLLYMIPYEVFVWIVLSIAVSLSGAVIVISMWPAFENDDKKLAVLVSLVLLAVHCAVMVSLRLYFFSPVYVPNIRNNATTPHPSLQSTVLVPTA